MIGLNLKKSILCWGKIQILILYKTKFIWLLALLYKQIYSLVNLSLFIYEASKEVINSDDNTPFLLTSKNEIIKQTLELSICMFELCCREY